MRKKIILIFQTILFFVALCYGMVLFINSSMLGLLFLTAFTVLPLYFIKTVYEEKIRKENESPTVTRISDFPIMVSRFIRFLAIIYYFVVIRTVILPLFLIDSFIFQIISFGLIITIIYYCIKSSIILVSGNPDSKGTQKLESWSIGTIQKYPIIIILTLIVWGFTGNYVTSRVDQGFTSANDIAKILHEESAIYTRNGAVCNDGSISTATGRGACSYHGGVDYWTTDKKYTLEYSECLKKAKQISWID